MRRPEVHGVGDQLWPHDPGRDPARHHDRKRARPPFRLDAVGGGETEGEHHGCVSAAEEGGQAEDPEGADDDRERRQQSAQDAAEGTGEERGSATVTLGD